MRTYFKYLIIGWSIVPIFLFPTYVCCEESILVCTSEKVAVFDPKGTNDVSIEVSKDKQTVIFAGLDTDNPRFKGNLGESSLKVLKRTSEGIWLMEETIGINLWTIFTKKKMFICSKQYTGFSGNAAFGLMFMGYCK